MRSFFLCVSMVVLLGSCSKSNDNNNHSDYFIRGRFGGERLEYRAGVIGVLEADKFTGLATQTLSSNFPSLSFEIDDLKDLKAGVYRETDSDLLLLFRLSLNGTSLFHSYAGDDEDFVLEITELNSSSIRGRFSGTIREAGNESNLLLVSSGEFYLPH